MTEFSDNVSSGGVSSGGASSGGVSELVLELQSHEEAMQVFGAGDRNLKLLRETFPVQLHGRGCSLRLSGERPAVDRVRDVIEDLISRYRSGAGIPPDHVQRFVERFVETVIEQGVDRRLDRFAVSSPTETIVRDERVDSDDIPRRGSSPSRPSPASNAVTPESVTPESVPTEAVTREAVTQEAGEGDSSSAAAAEISLVRRIARSSGQAGYLKAILENDIVFCTGPAGTGKTFLAVTMAIHLLRQDRIRKIILCRPAVEAGEKLGFLPGDFQAKINPYLRPLYDALNDLLDYDQVKRYMEREVIEILPLAYMRGRTLNNAFIILDEGQNTSVSQMKMFLTRMGLDSRIIVNGDITQVDLPSGQLSGLNHAQGIMRGIPGIAWVQLQKVDIVRHPLVRKIVAAYEVAESNSGNER